MVVAVVVGVGRAVAEETGAEESPGVIHARFINLVSQEGQEQFHPQFREAYSLRPHKAA